MLRNAQGPRSIKYMLGFLFMCVCMCVFAYLTSLRRLLKYEMLPLQKNNKF